MSLKVRRAEREEQVASYPVAWRADASDLVCSDTSRGDWPGRFLTYYVRR